MKKTGRVVSVYDGRKWPVVSITVITCVMYPPFCSRKFLNQLEVCIIHLLHEFCLV